MFAEIYLSKFPEVAHCVNYHWLCSTLYSAHIDRLLCFSLIFDEICISYDVDGRLVVQQQLVARKHHFLSHGDES